MRSGWPRNLSQRGLAHISHTTVGRIFARYHLPTQTYHSRARWDGIPKQRYEKSRPNQQWHIDFVETHLEDGTRVVILVLTDDYSRYCLRCQVVPDMTAETAIQVVQDAWREFGLPAELVSDNGRAFTTVHESTLTVFGQVPQQKGIQHRLITPYYPEGNGKAEAFVKIVKRVSQPSLCDAGRVGAGPSSIRGLLQPLPSAQQFGLSTARHSLSGCTSCPQPWIGGHPVLAR